MSIIVSLTSYSRRFPTLHLPIESILKQIYRPDKILLYVDKQDTLSQSVWELAEQGLEIRYFQEDLKPHNKYLHAMMDYPEDTIVTFDDDAIYRPDILSQLVAFHHQFPRTVITGRAHGIRLDCNGNPQPYREWDWEIPCYEKPSIRIMATGVGGTLYPPSCMHGELFNISNIKRLCLYSDDIWLKCMQILVGTKVVVIPNEKQHPQSILKIAQDGLFRINKDKNRNDEYLKNVTRAYDINWKQIFETYD